MHAQRLTATVFSVGAALVFGTPAMSADLPQSGTIKVHSTLKGNSQIVDVGEKHIMGAGNGWGVTFNDAGSGPLHMGAWMCTWTFQNVSSPQQEAPAPSAMLEARTKSLSCGPGPIPKAQATRALVPSLAGLGSMPGCRVKSRNSAK